MNSLTKNKKEIILCDLPDKVILNIIRFLTNSVDYNNFRIINKKIYSLIKIIKFFKNDKCIREIFFENQYYIYKEYFPNNKLKLEKKFIIDQYFEKYKTNVEKEYYNCGNLKRITNYKSNLKNGLEKVYFVNNILRRQSLYKNGVKINNEFINDIDGKLKYILEYNYIYIYLKKYEKNTICYDITLKNNNLHGECNFYFHGILRKNANYYNGLLDGICKTYRTFGREDIITYSNNKKNGLFLTFDYFNNVKLCGKYKNNRLNGTINYFFSGKMMKTFEMFHGLLHGKYIEYSDYKKIYNFHHNLLNGYYKEYKYTNTLRLQIKFNENIFDNIFKIYNIYGKLEKEYIFINDDYIVKKYERNKLVYSLYKLNSEYYLVLNNVKIKL